VRGARECRRQVTVDTAYIRFVAEWQHASGPSEAEGTCGRREDAGGGPQCSCRILGAAARGMAGLELLVCVPLPCDR